MVKHTVLKGFYELERTVGCGGFAKVKLATHLATGEKVAIKIMEKAQLKDNLPRVKLELRALKTLTHKHICKLYQVIETETHFYIIVEYCAGGELFDHIVEKNRLSETESRVFFRQIVSAVAYLHSLGYVHRDLKPENVLLDHSQNLKLIDFGLCAKPEGGIKSALFTSCGSPTYAAPELVLGKEYLGPEVDVWAMGVLLYALLAGFLPFEDQNIDTLYKKILSGKYDEPYFMSYASKRLIRQMLQIDPKKRITVRDLLSHPWLMSGVLTPIKIIPENNKCRDEDIVTLMAQYHVTPKEEMWEYIKRWRYDYDTATYLLLLARKNRGLPLQILPGATRLPIRVRSADSIKKNTENKEPTPRTNSTHLRTFKPETSTPPVQVKARIPSVRTPIMLQEMANETYCVNSPLKVTNIENMLTPQAADLLSPKNFVEPRKPSSIRKPLKRIRSPNLEGECSPVPTKKTPGFSTPRSSDRKHTPGGESSSGSARRVLGSIEKSLHRVRHVFTPKRPQPEIGLGPTVLASKDLCNVSTTQCTDAEFVITELSKALHKKGIKCDRKGFTLRGKTDPNVFHRFGGCSFELEICYLPTMGVAVKPSQSGSTPTKSSTPDAQKRTPVSKIPKRNGAVTNSGDFMIQKVCNSKMVGIRRKRLKGDSWCYKKVCEQVLALTATELQQTIV